MRKALYGTVLLFSLLLNTFAQEPVPSPSPQTTGESAAVVGYEAEFKKIQKENQEKIDALAKKIAEFEKGIGATNSLETRLNSLVGKVEALETINAVKNQNQVALDEVQYKTGLELMKTMLGNMEKLDFTIDLTTSVNNFQALTNPANNPTFKAEIETLKGNNLTNNNSGVQIDNALLANPYLSVAWSIGSVLISKFNKTDKPPKFNKLLCVIDVSTRTDADFKIIQSDLSNLSERIRKFNNDTYPLFENYTAAIGRKTTWQDFKTDSSPFGLLTEPTNTFFLKYKGTNGNIEAGSVPTELATARYQVEAVKKQLVEYDAILKQMDDFLAKFGDILKKHENLPNCESIPNLQSQLNSLVKFGTDNRAKFKSAYSFDVSARTRRILYGIN